MHLLVNVLYEGWGKVLRQSPFLTKFLAAVLENGREFERGWGIVLESTSVNY